MESISKSTTSSISAGTVSARTQQCLSEMKALQKPSKVILIIGRAGVGKSSILEDVTGSTDHSQQTVDSVTLKFEIEKAVLNGEDFYIMDTPGFDADNEQQTFHEIIRGIQAVRGSGYIAGILYVTSISQPRFDQFDRRFIRFIYALCGQEYASLTFVTTFWTAENQRQKTMYSNQVKLLRQILQEVGGDEQVRMYQHGRQYMAGQDTGRFLNWYENRDKIAQQAKDMITRSYSGQANGQAYVLAPKIIRELEDNVPIYYTDAGKLLGLPADVGIATSSANLAPDQGATSGQRYRLPNDEWEPSSWREERPVTDQNGPRTYTEPDNSSEMSWKPVFDFIKAGCSWLMEINYDAHRSTSSGSRSFGVGAHSGGFGDPNSVVDLMKLRGMDSSLSSREQYALAHGITGTVGSASWNTKIRSHISGGL